MGTSCLLKVIPLVDGCRKSLDVNGTSKSIL
jgi:hypothetical protein